MLQSKCKVKLHQRLRRFSILKRSHSKRFDCQSNLIFGFTYQL